MAQQTINLGTVANDGTGDDLRTGGDKINDNFTELYAADAALGTAAALDVDIDDTLAANSDSLIPTQQAVKAYVDANIGGGSGVDVEDEGVAEATGATTLNFVGAGVTAADAGGGIVDITIPGSSGGIDVEDEGVAEATAATVLNFTGAGVTATDAGGGTVDIDIPGGGSTAWALAGTGQTATGVYDQAVDGTKTNVDFVGLGSYNEFLIIARDVTLSSSGSRIVQVSVDNGSTFYSSSGDYVSIDNAGVAANTTAIVVHSTATTAARSFTANIRNTKGAAKSIDTRNNSYSQTLFVASASDINALRFLGTAGNINGGTIRIYAR